ncbi:hypothetical protein BegalDRAFT_2119 [Beggiatoa alba B18LD]|uniref:Right handed beta helix domain-containing protein n=1 Tax=Beggiatoa alba B18LD TaxID=395493 RepID=I3CH91_9GAMM|nr:right-handed parallel beta-helix repeat-containing protein [Beggiatoa alba]EIJ42984.1 hypothetical protein BegalDRAFT_2119 [Beggiatoa alba B18LD]
MQLIKIILVSFLMTFSTGGFAENFLQTYRLPPLLRVPPHDPIQKILRTAKVLQRAEAVSIPFAMVESPVMYEQALRRDFTAKAIHWAEEIPTVYFAEIRTSRLNSLLAKLKGAHKVIFTAPFITVDEPLQVPSETWIIGNNALLKAIDPTLQSSIVLNGVKQVQLSQLRIVGGHVAIQLKQAQQVQLDNIVIDTPTRAIVIQESAWLTLTQLQIKQAQVGGILLQGDTHHVLLSHSEIRDGQNPDNTGAAVLLTDVQALSASLGLTLHELAEPIYPPVSAPHAIIIEYNQIIGNRAQGIYSDGGYGNIIQHNYIKNNDKEGLCLDFGSVNNIIQENTLVRNGFRSRQTDDSLKQDFVWSFGKLADGSSVSKLPAISLDNAAQNLVIWNNIRESAGDGIKIVRTGIRNLILFNTLMNNNQGQNSRFHFFGILLGNASAEPEIAKQAIANPVLDFIPAIENIVAGNVIDGNHYSGILLDSASAFNDIYDNMIRHYQNQPLENASTATNSIVGNSWQVENAPTGWRAWFH